jgi:probable phosphoglycerate mutase
MSSTRVILIRHGESQVAVDKIIGGFRTCNGLSELGRRQATALGKRFAFENEQVPGTLVPAVFIASHFARAQETAQLIAHGIGNPPLLTDPEFGEHDPGPMCDGMPYADFLEKFGHRNWETDPYDETYPGGETVAAFQLRVGSALRRVVDAHPGETIVISCHAGVIDTCLRYALRAAPTGEFEVHTVNTSVTEIVHVRPGRWKLVRYNDTGHLLGIQ